MSEPGSQPAQGGRRAKPPLIIGVGASASAIDSIERFFSKLTLSSDQTIVLALQHREALDEGRLRAMLQRPEGTRLSEVQDGAAIEGGTIYLCPTDGITTIQGGRLAVRKAEQVPGERATIDSFLVSLAEERAEEAIGVVLAGTGDDGTLGAATLKDRGGLAIAGRATNGHAAQLADGNNAAAIADVVLPPEEIPEHIQVYARRLPQVRSLGPDVRLERRAQRVAERYAPAYVVTDENFQVLHFSGRTDRYVEPTGDAATLDLFGLVHRDLRLALRTAFSRAAETNKAVHAEQVQLGVNGHRIVVDITVESIQDDVGGRRNFVVLFKDGPVRVVDDVTAIIRAEERQLLAELQHRVRNTLGVVRSIARRSAETSSSVEEYAAHLDGRLNAFARTQAMVMRDPEGSVDLEYLVIEELLGYTAREGEHLYVSGPRLRFRAKAAETFALAVHELATNALKYGALSQPSGRIEINWRIDEAVDPPRLVFDWCERNGPPVTAPPRKGFGTELLERTLAFELKGQSTMMFNAGGLHCTISIPLSRRTIHTPVVGS
ncbi:chemotaxis protein CheB [Bradyrhizobium cenepequi]|uniref:chemotaxis protein CheB n=1 Tax=Bradyrhizobium cenepequi TaxID=2821403 RepID=UPI001CE36FFA|nr:chemotaxis protein CheB [Bradyrhizobium cenepequi]MCA6110024.1 hypothetical protein [Bradyrhizobium cenepequi]